MSRRRVLDLRFILSMGRGIFSRWQINQGLGPSVRETGRCLVSRYTNMVYIRWTILTRVPGPLHGPPALSCRTKGRIFFEFLPQACTLCLLWRLFLQLLQFNVCPPRVHRINLSPPRSDSRLRFSREMGLWRGPRRDHAECLSSLALKENRSRARERNDKQPRRRWL